MRRLMQYALAYPYSWHYYAKDRATTRAVRRLVEMGMVTTNASQFRLMVPERYFNAMEREAKRNA